MERDENKTPGLVQKTPEVTTTQKTPEVTDEQIDNSAKATGQQLKKEEMVEIKIPVDPLNPKDLMVPVVIDGYIYQIKRGEKVKVPKEVEKILERAKII